MGRASGDQTLCKHGDCTPWNKFIAQITYKSYLIWLFIFLILIFSDRRQSSTEQDQRSGLKLFLFGSSVFFSIKKNSIFFNKMDNIPSSTRANNQNFNKNCPTFGGFGVCFVICFSYRFIKFSICKTVHNSNWGLFLVFIQV